MPDKSLKPIEQMEVGDEVLSFDEASGGLVTGNVTDTFEHPSPSEGYLRINGRVNVTVKNNE